MKNGYTIEYFLDDIFFVLSSTDEIKFEGSLEECRAYLRLVNGGYV